MALAVFLMVVIGGVTRLTDSGLSMVEWRLLMGTLPPLSEQEWERVFSLYQEKTAQAKIVNPNMTLSEFKGIFFWEYIHRLWGRMLGVLFIVPFISFWVLGFLNSKFTKKLLIALVLGGSQGLLGWFMVKSGIGDDEAIRVSAYRLSAHLLLAFFLFAYLVWLTLEVFKPKLNKPGHSDVVTASWLLIALFTVQSLFGGFMAGIRGALSYPTFPKMNGEWIPSALWISEMGWQNIAENPAFVHFVHRILAGVLCIMTIYVWGVYRSYQTADGHYLYTKVLDVTLFVILVQFLLGVSVVLNSVGTISVSLGSLHQSVAVILLGCYTVLLYLSSGSSKVDINSSLQSR